MLGFGFILPISLFFLILLFLIWRIGNELEEIEHRFLPPRVIHSPL